MRNQFTPAAIKAHFATRFGGDRVNQLSDEDLATIAGFAENHFLMDDAYHQSLCSVIARLYGFNPNAEPMTAPAITQDIGGEA